LRPLTSIEQLRSLKTQLRPLSFVHGFQYPTHCRLCAAIRSPGHGSRPCWHCSCRQCGFGTLSHVEECVDVVRVPYLRFLPFIQVQVIRVVGSRSSSLERSTKVVPNHVTHLCFLFLPTASLSRMWLRRRPGAGRARIALYLVLSYAMPTAAEPWRSNGQQCAQRID
jgi:hypothetical protein